MDFDASGEHQCRLNLKLAVCRQHGEEVAGGNADGAATCLYILHIAARCGCCI